MRPHSACPQQKSEIKFLHLIWKSEHNKTTTTSRKRCDLAPCLPGRDLPTNNLLMIKPLESMCPASSGHWSSIRSQGPTQSQLSLCPCWCVLVPLRPLQSLGSSYAGRCRVDEKIWCMYSPRNIIHPQPK